MMSLTIRNIPDELYGSLKQQAETHRRSLNSEILTCLERVVQNQDTDVERVIAAARRLRKKTIGLHVTQASLKKIKDEGRP